MPPEMKVVPNSLHQIIFKDSWQYDSNILKRYCVSLRVRNKKTLSIVNSSVNQYVHAYDENEASILAVKKYNNERICDVLEARCQALSIISEKGK